MKEELLEILGRVNYPYDRVGRKDAHRILDIHKHYFGYRNSFYADRKSSGCSSCIVGVLNDLINGLGFKDQKEVRKVDESMYANRKRICEGCPAMQRHGKMMTCGNFGEATKGRHPTCGCLINVKAQFKIFDCPRKKWTK
jgi:hypothetical protein